MPDCYLLAICESSSLSKDTNNYSLFNLIENIHLETDKALPQNGEIPIPMQTHAYWFFSDDELNKDYEFRFVFETREDTRIWEKTFQLKSKTPKFRVRIRGMILPGTGNGLLRVEWRAIDEKNWHRCSIFWPFELTLTYKKPSEKNPENQNS